MVTTPRPTREQYRRRERLADALLDRVAATGDPSLPRAAIPDPTGVFGDEAAVLTHLAARWSRNLAGSLDPVLDLPLPARDRAAAEVAARLAIRRPALHAVLHRYAEHPAVCRARETDRTRAGLVTAPVHAEHVPPRWATRPDGAARRRCPVARRVAVGATACRGVPAI